MSATHFLLKFALLAGDRFQQFFNMQSKRKCAKSLNAIYLRSQKTRSNRDQFLFRFTPLKRQNASVFRDFPRFGFPHFGVFCGERETW